MSTRRLCTFCLTVAAFVFCDIRADACCLTDWLYGRTATPYAAGYAPNGQTYAAGYAPILATPYTSQFASQYTALPLSTPAINSGVYQAQRPSYSNPSVYSGLPTAGNVQTAYSVPMTSALPLRARCQALPYRSTMMPINSSYMSGYNGSIVGASPASPGLPITPSVVTGAPATALPATQVAPLFPAAPVARRGGLARFFGSLFGTNYTSAYYRAPVTYYRPVTSVDPVSGTTVTVQRPCTSSVQQLQRTPYSSFQAATSTPLPSAGCQTAPYAAGEYGATGYGFAQPGTNPINGLPPSGVGQASAIGSTPGSFTVPIPSTVTPNTYSNQPGFAPNVAPLTGSPMQPRSQSGSGSGLGDSSPVDQPRLENYQRTESGYRSENDDADDDRETKSPARDYLDQAPKSYWELQDAKDSTALIRPRADRSKDSAPKSSTNGSEVLSNPSFTAVEPIRGLDEDASPFRQYRGGDTTPVRRSNLEAPPLPPASEYQNSDYGRSGASNASVRSFTPFREAGLMRTSHQEVESLRPVTPPPRDNNWKPIR